MVPVRSHADSNPLLFVPDDMGRMLKIRERRVEGKYAKTLPMNPTPQDEIPTLLLFTVRSPPRIQRSCDCRSDEFLTEGNTITICCTTRTQSSSSRDKHCYL